MLEKSCRKTCGPLRLTGVKNPHTDVRKIVPYVHKRQKSQFLRERQEYAEGPWHSIVGPAFPGGGGEKESGTASFQSHSSPGWQVSQWPAAAFSLAGDGCGEGNFSAEVELLSADCR